MVKDNLLNVSKLHFSYGDKKVLKGISFKVEEGEKLGIIGESGSGKTSLLKLISGSLDADSGKITFRNNEVKGPAHKLIPGHDQIKMVHQDFDLMPYISVDENILRSALYLSSHARKKLLKNFHQKLRLKDFKKQKGEDISGGQKQRVALASAMASQPQLLLLDEPFSNLDYSLKQYIIDLLKEEGRTESRIIVAHDPADIMALADRLLVLQKGRIIQRGNSLEVYRYPKNEYVARLLGPVNILSPVDLKLFGIETTKNCIVRPDDLLVSGSGTAFDISEMRFIAGKYTYKCQLSNGSYLSLETKSEISSGQKISLSRYHEI